MSFNPNDDWAAVAREAYAAQARRDDNALRECGWTVTLNMLEWPSYRERADIEMSAWLKENCITYEWRGAVIAFETETDAVAFKTRFR